MAKQRLDLGKKGAKWEKKHDEELLRVAIELLDNDPYISFPALAKEITKQHDIVFPKGGKPRGERGIAYRLHKLPLSETRVEIAFRRKDFFIKPWIGEKYDEGFLERRSKEPIKILIIGASRYCKLCLDSTLYLKTKRCKKICGDDACDYDKLNDLQCTFLKEKGRSGTGNLQYMNRVVIDEVSRLPDEESEYRTYKNFHLTAKNWFELPKGTDIWNKVAFINYYQPIVTSGIRTPYYSKERYRSSKQAVDKIIELLSPDIIFLWYSDHLGNKQELFDTYTEKENYGCIERASISIKSKRIVMIVMKHPASKESNNKNADDNIPKEVFETAWAYLREYIDNTTR